MPAVTTLTAIFGEASSGGDAAPWWGVPLVAGGFLIIGAVLAFVFNRLNEDRKAKHAAAMRWDAELREIGAKAIVSARGILQIAAQDLRHDYISAEALGSADYRASASKIAQLVEELVGYGASLEIIAPAAVNATLANVIRASRALCGAYNPGLTALPDLEACADHLHHDTLDFVNALRVQLGLQRALDHPDLDLFAPPAV